ncbi:MAG: hypothetical protein ACI4TW_01420 [Prevotella sp.]
MMFPFTNIRPRRFHHPMMYADERRQRLLDIEARARHELGIKSEGQPPVSGLRGAFTGRSSQLRRKSSRSVWGRAGNAVLIVALLALLLVIRYIFMG